MSDPLKERPLTFGDKEQIDELRRREAMEEFNDIPNCRACNGTGDCGECGRECTDCDGEGKNLEELQRFKKCHPGWRRYQ